MTAYKFVTLGAAAAMAFLSGVQWATVLSTVAAKIAAGAYAAIAFAAAVASGAWAAAMKIATVAVVLLGVALAAAPLFMLGYAAVMGMAAAESIAAIGGAASSTGTALASLGSHLKAIGGSSLQGLLDAFRSKDWALAWQIFQAAGMAALAEISFAGLDIWTNWKYALLEVWQQVGYKVEDTFEDAATFLRGATRGWTTAQTAEAMRQGQLDRDARRGERGQHLADAASLAAQIAAIRAESAAEFERAGLAPDATYGQLFRAVPEARQREQERAARIAPLQEQLNAVYEFLGEMPASLTEQRDAELANAQRGRADERAGLRAALGTLTAQAAEPYQLVRDFMAEFEALKLQAASPEVRAEAMDMYGRDLNQELEYQRYYGREILGLDLPDPFAPRTRMPGLDELDPAAGQRGSGPGSFGSFLGAAISAMSISTPAERQARAAERQVEQNDRIIALLGAIAEEEGGLAVS